MGVFSLTGWCRQIPTGRLRPRSTQDTTMYASYFIYGTITLCGRPFQTCSIISCKSTLWSYNPHLAVTKWVWAVSCSLATTYEIIVIFSSSAYLDVSVQRVCFSFEMIYLQYTGLPHSEISGSMCICHSPKLIAAYHVLLRLQEPRHPPYALNYFLCLRVNTQFFYTRYCIQMS